MKKVLNFVKGRREDKKDAGITPSQSRELLSPAQTPEDELFLGLDNTAGYIVDFCGKDKSLTKLHKAAWQGNLDKVKNALKKIDIDTVDRHNRTALHFSVAQGHPNIVWFLLGNNARHTICDEEGRTAVLKAVECGHKESLSLLLDRGANINHADFSGITSIHIATKQGFIDIANTLIEKGADPDVPNNNGEYPIHAAVRAQNKDMVQLLLKGGASVNSVDHENRTPLMLAAKLGNIILAQLCIEYGAQLFVVDSNGWTAEDYALLGGHQTVAAEIKGLMSKKDGKPALGTHEEEDENDCNRSDIETTWNDSNLSDGSKSKPPAIKMKAFLRKFSDDSEGSVKVEKDSDLVESPGSGVVPPPCQPPRSWEIIEAGMIDEAMAEGGEPKRRSITALGSLHSRKESFTDTTSGSQVECPKYTLSLNRRKDSKKGSTTDVKQRFSFNEEESLRCSISDDFSLLLQEDKDFVKHSMPVTLNEECERQKHDSGSDWDSNFSSSVNNEHNTLLKSPNINSTRENLDGTLGRRDTMKENEELWLDDQNIFPDPPSRLPDKVEEETEVSSSSWDSGESNNDNGPSSFPPPPSEFELGVDIARSKRKMRGISIDHGAGCSVDLKMWRKAYDEQSHSLDSVGEKDCEPKSMDVLPETSKSHSRQPSISNHKWHSVELPQQQRPSNRLVDVNRRISQQLECYDQALKELAESPFAKKQDAIISTLRETSHSNIDNYYSLPSSKLRRDIKTASFRSTQSYRITFPTQFGFQNGEENGSLSLPLPGPPHATEELENNERLGFEEKAHRLVKPITLNLETNKADGLDNLESPISDDLTGSDKSERKSKRHMLLAMRDVKHAVQVTASFKSSLDEHVLSPLVHMDGEFDLSANNLVACESEETSPGNDHAYFCNDTEGLLGRQETVIERTAFHTRSSASESGDEPTLWLQEKSGGGKPASAPTSEDESEEAAGAKFSPLGVVYKELQAERRLMMTNDGTGNNSEKVPESRTPSSTLRRLQRLDSSSDNEDSLKERKINKVAMVEDVECSPDVSFSSGPIEPLGRDSGSEPESSQHDPTPVHQFSLKKHHKWLKEKLQNENKERHHLEEVAAQLAEKTERLQYELADAKEASKSRDEIITLLQGQLARMETAYTKSLEESVHCRLQLTTLEHEILHLKELCAQYEDERESRKSEGVNRQCSELMSRVKELEEEREGLSRVVVHLEQENRTLEGKKKNVGTEEKSMESWTQRGADGENNSSATIAASTGYVDAQKFFKIKNTELESQIKATNDINKQLENRLDDILSNHKLTGHLEINESILLLNKKNSELESQLRLLIEELGKTKRIICDERQFCDKNTSNNKPEDNQSDDHTNGYKDGHESRPKCIEVRIESLQMENAGLLTTIEEMKLEMSRLKQKPNTSNDHTLPNLLNEPVLIEERDERDSSVMDLDGLVMESEKLREELGNINEEKSVPIEVEDLKKEVQGLKEALEEAKKGEAVFESQHMNRLSSDGRLRATAEGKGARENELAWSNLYGMKNVRQNACRKLAVSSSSIIERPTSLQYLMPLDRDSEEFIELKVRELEDELEKAKEEILRQRLESNIKMQEIMIPKTNNLQVLELKNRMMDLEREVMDEREARSLLQRRTDEISFGLKDKRKLEFELGNLKSTLQREYVPKDNVAATQLQLDLALARKQDTKSEEMLSLDANLVEHCETLAKEKHRADELERRLAKETTWNDENCHRKSRSRLDLLSQEGSRSIHRPANHHSLDEETKSKLAQQLEDSIKRYYEAPVEEEETSAMNKGLPLSKILD